ncbi:hypothetical protein [Hyphococcus sp.]|uniref:aldose epimerase family protein n=1 Tax=Hyphococcus sp. TaxID=2038636 RepID=UPI003CCBAE27
MLEIADGHYSAWIAPEAGGSLMSLRYRGRDMLRPAANIETVAADPREAACYPCVPWFGRLRGGLDFGARHYDLAPTLPACDPEHALHGHVWTQAWEISRRAPARATCRLDYQPAPMMFPFPFRAEQSFYFDRGFHLSLRITNIGCGAMPAGLGLHPFFPNGEDAEINIAETTGENGDPAAIEHSGPVPSKDIDKTLRGWNGRAEIVQNSMRIAMRSNARFLHLYSPENADFFCAEPITHEPGDFGSDHLAPGEDMEITLRLRAEE